MRVLRASHGYRLVTQPVVLLRAGGGSSPGRCRLVALLTHTHAPCQPPAAPAWPRARRPAAIISALRGARVLRRRWFLDGPRVRARVFRAGCCLGCCHAVFVACAPDWLFFAHARRASPRRRACRAVPCSPPAAAVLTSTLGFLFTPLRPARAGTLGHLWPTTRCCPHCGGLSLACGRACLCSALLSLV